MNKHFFNMIVACTILLFFLVSTWGVSSPHAAETSKVIKHIETEGLSRIEDSELINLICNCIGRELDMNVIRAGIRRAFRKGIFLDIKVVLAPHKDGLSLIYAVTEVPVINKITIEGHEPFLSKQIQDVFYFKEDDDYRAEYLEDARMTIVDFYERKGFPDAEVDVVVHKIEGESIVNLNVKIMKGQPVIIKSLTASEGPRYLWPLSSGDVFDLDEMDESVKKLKDYYKKRNYIKPEVGPYEYNEGNIIIPVNPGPQLEVQFHNRTVFSKKELMKEVTYIENEEVNDELTEEIVGRIRKLYISKGYYYAQIAAGIETNDNVITVTFIIFEDQPVVLRSVVLNGVTIKEKAVLEVLSLPVNKPFNDNRLSSSRDSLIRFYKAIGYSDMEVTDIKKIFSNDKKSVDIEIYVIEGPQKRIEEINIKGNEAIGIYKIRRALRLHKGVPYNRVDIGDSRYRILSLYGEKGYLDARVQVESIVEREKINLTFSIVEGRPSVVGKIIVRGNSITKLKIIEREITLEEGGFYDSNEVTKIKQNLYKLGLFNQVSIKMLKPVRTSDGRIVRDMLVSLKESNAGSVEFIFGYGDYEKFRGAFDISYKNIGGYNREIGFRMELSDVEKKFVLNFREPWLFNKPDIPLKVYLVKEEKSSIDIETREVFYDIDKLGFIAGIEKELMKGLKVGIAYEYSSTDTTNVAQDVILSKDDTGTIGIGSISTSLFYDTRDNPFDPTSGYIHGIVLKFASEAFLSEAEFIKVSFQNAWYFPLHKRVVFACSLKGGISYSYDESEDLPLIERFFLGGRSSVRGYDYDKLGPKGADGSPTGGNVYALTNGELRFYLGKGIGLVTFVDGGNVWQTIDEVETDLKYTVGGGLRYKTPVGPVRIDYGYKLDREHDESAGEVYFSFGHAF